ERGLAPNLGLAASFSACAARASFVQIFPVITAAAPMTALRMMKVRRSMLAGISDSVSCVWDSSSFLSGVSMVVSPVLLIALNSFDAPLRAGFHVRRIRFIGVNVHRQRKSGVCAHEHVAKYKLAV